MNINEIEKQKWKVSKNLIRNTWKTRSISNEEQECMLNILKQIADEGSDKGIMVDCSFQEYILKLSRCEYFELQEVLYHIDSGFVLEVKGIMECAGITIRTKKKKEMTKEQKKIFTDRMRKYREET